VHIIIGLGNTGSVYAETRHNIGFRVIDAVAEQRKIILKPGKGEYWIGRSDDGGEDLLLIKPTTMMNSSGIAVRDVIERFEAGQKDFIIVYDDLHLPLGTLRFRQHGSDGGHNGMGSILYHLQSDEVQRLRCGIRSSLQEKEEFDLVDFVLSPFDRAEYDGVQAMIRSAREALDLWIDEGIISAMNRWNPPREE
jgi:peptidyl-tRNA hydrolase, PTH1 family